MTKTYEAGDRIAWLHYAGQGAAPVLRTGTVWSGAPTGNGLVNAWWVHPDYYQPGELTAGGVVAVGRSSRRAGWRHHYEPAKGEVYGASWWEYQPANLTSGAAGAQAAIRGHHRADREDAA